jgi:hypothetical protein
MIDELGFTQKHPYVGLAYNEHTKKKSWLIGRYKGVVLFIDSLSNMNISHP